MTDNLRIRPLPSPPRKEKRSFSLPEPTIETLDRYLSAFADIYGKKGDPDFIVNEILVSFFESDRAFAAWCKEKAAAADDEAEKKRGKKNESAAETVSSIPGV